MRQGINDQWQAHSYAVSGLGIPGWAVVSAANYNHSEDVFNMVWFMAGSTEGRAPSYVETGRE